MQTEDGKKYIISEDKLEDILNNMLELSPDGVNELMYRNLMHRTIFKHEDINKDSGQTSWIRIRVGDINCEGISQCTVTFKEKKHEEDKTNVSQFIAEDYYSVVQFFRDIKMPLVSEQETKRSKYVFYYENAKYVICFDIWPHLQDMVFVTLDTEDNIAEERFKLVCESLELPQKALQVGYVDIDKAYEEYFGKKASEIRQLRFNFPLDVN